MNTFFIIASLLVAGSSAQYWAGFGALPISISSQYHAQDELGQFAFGHHSGTQSREEVKSIDGAVRGAYSYVDPAGKLIHVQYLADHNGFRVLGANNLPVAPVANLEVVKDTPEVVAARAEFARKFEEAKAGRIPETVSRRRRDILHTPLLSTFLAKTTLKTSEFVPVDAKVPAATKLAEFKEKEKEIITPYSVPTLVHTPILTPSIVSPSLVVKAVKPIEHKLEIQPILTSRYVAAPIISYSNVPLVGKATIKTSELKTLDDAKTPAATRLAEVKEVEKDVLTPLTWTSPLAHSTLFWV